MARKSPRRRRIAQRLFDGADDTDRCPLGCKLGFSVDERLLLGWVNGIAEIDGFLDSIDDGCANTMGNFVLVGLVLGWLDG